MTVSSGACCLLGLLTILHRAWDIVSWTLIWSDSDQVYSQDRAGTQGQWLWDMSTDVTVTGNSSNTLLKILIWINANCEWIIVCLICATGFKSSKDLLLDWISLKLKSFPDITCQETLLICCEKHQEFSILSFWKILVLLSESWYQAV